MTEEKFNSTLSDAREHKNNKRFSDAVKCYETIYATYSDGYPQWYDYSHHYAIYQNYENSYTGILQDEEPPPFIRDWKIEMVLYFSDIVSEYTECLLYSNNPDFKLESSAVYNRMTSYETIFECKRKNGENYAVAKNPYPYTFQTLKYKHVFKSGTWRGMTLWEVELVAPEKILQMVLSIPTASSDSKLDLAIDRQFFLSKHRAKGKLFFTALETNYSKMAAVAEWQHREMLEEIKYDNEDYDAELEAEGGKIITEEEYDRAEKELEELMDKLRNRPNGGL